MPVTELQKRLPAYFTATLLMLEMLPYCCFTAALLLLYFKIGFIASLLLLLYCCFTAALLTLC
jgi:hypothetical protein